jgi:hypothetical protein
MGQPTISILDEPNDIPNLFSVAISKRNQTKIQGIRFSQHNQTEHIACLTRIYRWEPKGGSLALLKCSFRKDYLNRRMLFFLLYLVGRMEGLLYNHFFANF